MTPPSLTRLVTRLRVDPGLIVAAALGLLASWPLLSRPGLPQLTDVEHHIYRTFEILTAWQAGVWYLRWAPDLYYSYGYPVFHYYAPLTYYLAAAYGALIGGPVAGVKFVLVLALYLGALGSYLFIRELWGVYGGIIGAATYTLSPYFVFVDPYQRGAVPETLALGLGPWLFWAIIRLERTPSLRRMVSAAFILALLSLAHNLMSFAFLGVVLLWFGFEQLFARRTRMADRLRLWAVVVGAVALGLGLTAFMWLPAALEREAVQYSRATQHTLDDIWRHFLPLSQLMAPVSRNDMLATLAPRIGVAQWVLGLMGAASVWRRRKRRVTLGFFLILALGLI
ncbi:MAG: 6-pyruvoyl-tetrahydropterin synthase-related protein, partial [Anaerolineales bacterium]